MLRLTLVAIIAIAFLSAGGGRVALGGVMATALRCEYLTDPLGIDVTTPRFTWVMDDPTKQRGQRQTGFHVLVASSPKLLDQDRGDVWDSGTVKSSQSALVPFAGRPLSSGQECFWKVRVLDMTGVASAWSETARFSMGLLEPDDWTGPWIKHPDAPEERHVWFRKTLALDAAPASAMISVASVGYHELYVNGAKADDRLLAPAQTRLDTRVLYVTYDVAPLLKAGRNCIGIWTAAGWSKFKSYKTETALRVQLNGRTAAGTAISVASDTSWRCRVSGSRDIGKFEFGNYGAEEVDARQHDPRWNAVDLDDRDWLPAKTGDVKAALSAEMIEPSRSIGTIKATRVTGEGPYKVTFEKNFTGWIAGKMRGQSAGDVVKFKVSDSPSSAQAFGQSSEYICSGDETETFSNRFNYALGRYLTIEGLRTAPTLADVEGHAIASGLERTGTFTCSNDLLNRIYETDLWTFLANTVEGYTADCPHRERFGYGEVAFATSWGCALPNYRAGAFYTKVVRDWRDVQRPNGWINHTAPQTDVKWGGTLWSSAPLNVSWEHYKTYGDERLLADNYACYKSWVDFLDSKVKNGLLQPYNMGQGAAHFLGEWAAPYLPGEPLKGKEFGDKPEAQMFNNCVYAMNLDVFVRVAKILGKADDAAVYAKRLDALRPAIHAKFYDPAEHTYIDAKQVHLAFPMLVGVTPGAERPAVLARFLKTSLEERPFLDMGSSGLPVLLKFLVEDAERSDIVMRALSKTTEPSYGYFFEIGESTWPEYWDGKGASRAHTCYTGIASWFIKGLGGIREDPRQYGFQSFVVKPMIVGDLTFAEARTESLYGQIVSRWERTDGTTRLSVTVPPNSAATIYVPAAKARDVTESGVEAARAAGVTFDKMDGSYAVFRVGAGVYAFTSSQR